MANEHVALVTAEELAANHPPHSCELVAGRVLAVSPAGMRHTWVVGRVNMALSAHVAKHEAGLVTSGEGGYWVRRNPDSVRAPDVAYLSNATLERSRAATSIFFPTAPDLAVEVLSPDDRWADVEQKVGEYLGAEGRLVWVLDPSDETVHIYQPDETPEVLTGDDELTGGQLLPGFAVRVAELFAT